MVLPSMLYIIYGLPFSVTGHNNSRWNENKEEVNNNETRVGNPVYSVSIQYKLANWKEILLL